MKLDPNKPNILVSACLLGSKTRYDGKSKPYPSATALVEFFNVIPICPEAESGMVIPRPPSEIKGDRVYSEDGTDVTDFYKRGSSMALTTAKKFNVKFAILKERSPSCGSSFIHDGLFDDKVIPGEGITTRLLRQNGFDVFAEEKIPVILKAEFDKRKEQED